MTQDDARAYRSAISDLLKNHSLDWIVEQAEEKISLGRLVTKEVDASPAVPDPSAGIRRRTSRGKMTEFLSTEAYLPTEQLEILLDAIDLGLVAPVKMENALVEILARDRSPSASDLKKAALLSHTI